MEDPFKVEDYRNKLALDNLPVEFKKTYSQQYPEIKNPNTKTFWNNHFETELRLGNQDNMTKDKINIIFSLIPNKKVEILDLGFGQGYFEEKLMVSKKKYSLSGIDISSFAVERAREKFIGNFIQGNIAHVTKFYKKNSFDVIVAVELIEHISPRNIFMFYKSIYSLLKKGGILILSTPLNEGLRHSRDNPSGHVRDYQPAVIKMELELSGFKILETHQLHAFRKYYNVKKFLAAVFPWKWKPNSIIVMAEKVGGD